MTCIFCRILAGDLPATFLARTPNVSAFMDIQPVNPGHLLVVPNAHAALLADVPAEVAAGMFTLAQRLDTAIRQSGLRCEGVNLYVADGEAAGQEVEHVHLHVFPRFAGDGFGLKFPEHYHDRPPREDLETAASRIRTQRE